MLILLLAASLSGAAPADPPAVPPGRGSYEYDAEAQVRIPLAGFRIRDFRAVDDETLYFRTSRRDWYRADMIGPCFALRSALRIGLDTHGSSTLDNTSSVVAGGESCRIHSLVRSGPPERR